jgi:uncharacterized damage-inducible protein DinB
MQCQTAVASVKEAKAFFDRSTRPLTEAHSGFAPKPGMFTVAHHVYHVAQTIDWFIDGAFGDKGFDMDFEKGAKEMLAVTSLAKAREALDRAAAHAIEVLGSKTDAQLAEKFPPNPIMGEVPKWTIIGGLQDHTAHHRGALTVYERLLGLEPPMPYMET